LLTLRLLETYSDMPDNRSTRAAVAKANNALTRAKEEEKETGKPVSAILQKALKDAIKAYEAE
jgi:hypothetical protein